MSNLEVKRVAICRLCGKELEMYVSNVNGCFKGVQFKCGTHGTLKKGERYMMGYVNNN